MNYSDLTCTNNKLTYYYYNNNNIHVLHTVRIIYTCYVLEYTIYPCTCTVQRFNNSSFILCFYYSVLFVLMGVCVANYSAVDKGCIAGLLGQRTGNNNKSVLGLDMDLYDKLLNTSSLVMNADFRVQSKLRQLVLYCSGLYYNNMWHSFNTKDKIRMKFSVLIRESIIHNDIFRLNRMLCVTYWKCVYGFA